MYEDMRVKYLGINLSYPTYLKMQICLVVLLLIASALCFLFLRDHSFWFWRYLWLIWLVIAPLEILETVLAVGKAKKEYRSRYDDESGY